jgi:hypothetical protein
MEIPCIFVCPLEAGKDRAERFFIESGLNLPMERLGQNFRLASKVQLRTMSHRFLKGKRPETVNHLWINFELFCWGCRAGKSV